jgi:hypothetical protein
VVPFAFILSPSYRNRWAGFKRIEEESSRKERKKTREKARMRQALRLHLFRPFSFLSAIEIPNHAGTVMRL